MGTDWSDRAQVLKEVLRYGWALKYASDHLKNDPEIVLAAKQDGWALEWMR